MIQPFCPHAAKRVSPIARTPRSGDRVRSYRSTDPGTCGPRWRCKPESTRRSSRSPARGHSNDLDHSRHLQPRQRGDGCCEHGRGAHRQSPPCAPNREQGTTSVASTEYVIATPEPCLTVLIIAVAVMTPALAFGGALTGHWLNRRGAVELEVDRNG